MNRVLLALNVCLALFLGYRIVAAGGDAVAAGRDTASWNAADIREVMRTYADGRKRLARLTIDLGDALAAPPSGGGQPVDLGLHVEPACPMATFLRTPRRVELAFDRPLLGGRRYTLHLARPLSAASGRVFEPGVVVAFETPTVALDHVAVVETEPDGAVELVASFDLPVDLDELRPHLQLRDPATDADLSFDVTAESSGSTNLFRIAPTSDALPNHLRLIVTAGLLPRDGDVATRDPQFRTVMLGAPLMLTGARLDDGSVELAFNQAVGLPEAGLIEVEPATPFQVFQRGSGLRIVGAFPPGDVLGVVLRAGFPGRGRQVLEADQRRSLLVPDRDPELDFARRGSVLSVRAEPVLEVRTVNVDAFHLRVRRVYPNNAVRMLQDGDAQSMAPGVEREIRVDAPRNEEAIARVDLRELMDTDRQRGLFLVELWADTSRWRRSQRLVQLTDLGVSVRAASDAAAVQVVSIADGGAITDAEVRVVSPTNQLLATGATDVRGIAILHWPADGADRSAYLVQVRAGEDEAFVDLQSGAVELADPTLGGRPFAGSEPEAYVWPTRGIVRPGERIEAAVLLRDAAGRAVAGREIVVAFEQPNGRTFRRQSLTTPGSGLVSATVETTTDVPAGTWQVRVLDGEEGSVLGAAPLRVEAFVPYRLEAEVAATAPLRFGGSGAVRVSGRWLDGAPAAGREVELRVRLLPGTFAPATAAGFTFASGSDAPPPGELPSLRGVLDAEGVAEFRLPLPVDASQQALTAHLMADVMDPSGRAVHAAAQEPLLRSGLHLGVATTADGVELRAVAADGTAIAGEIAASVRLERRRWHWDYRGVGSSRWRWRTVVENEVLGEWPVTLRDGVASVPMEFPAGRGWLAVVATADGVTSERDVGDVPARPDRLRVDGPSAPVAPGEVAHIQVDAPAAGRGFVTLEGPTVLGAHVVELAKGHNEVAVPIPAGVLVPNLHAVVTLTRPAREVGPDAGPAWLVGGAAVALRRDDVVGEIVLQAPERLLPETELACEVVAPGATAAVVAVVDEGVLAITGHGDPDPVGFFLAQRRLAVDGADAFAALMEGATFVPGTKTGGDGDDLASLLTIGSISPRIRPLARFAEVRLDADGRGVARFVLPPYEGRVRVMALAAGPASVAGVARATVVSAPLGLQAAAPRIVAPGDQFVVPVSLRNDTGAAGDVALRSVAVGGLELVEEGLRTVALGVGEQRTVEVAVRALAAATDGADPELQIEAVLGGERRTATAPVHVRELSLHVVDHLGVRLGDPQELVVPAEFATAGLRATLEIDAAPDAHLRPALEALVRYPYGCVEQTTSRSFAVLACQALLPRIYGADAAPIEPGEFVQAGIDRLIGMQNARGGFGWWPGARSEYPFGTVYAMDFLLAAQERGFPVPDTALRHGLAAVGRIAADVDLDLSLRSVACEVLSRAGRPSRGLVEWLATQVTRIEDRALIALAMERLGEGERAAELLRGDDTIGDVREQGGMLRSPLRARALRFRARLAVDPADPTLPAEAWAIQREILATDRRSTQELGQVLRALAAYYGVSRTDGMATLRGTIDGAPLPEPVDGRIELPARPGSVVALEAGGQGFALLTMRGSRPPRATAGDGSLTVRRVFLDPDTGAEVTQFRRGRVYEVRLLVHASRTVENLVIADVLPGGLEAEAPPPGAAPARERSRSESGPDARIERRDDRVLLFCSAQLRGDFTFSHHVRATFPGRYAAPPPVAEAMYDPGAVFVGTGSGGVEILP